MVQNGAFYIVNWGFPNDYNEINLHWPIIFNKSADLKIYANQDTIVIQTPQALKNNVCLH